MPKKSTSRLQQLHTFPADELAAFIDALANKDETVEKSVNLFLKRNDPKCLGRAIGSIISGLKRGSRFIDYYASEGMAQKLHGILDSIERDLMPRDPVIAVRMLARFIETDSAVIGNADDSNGVIGDAYHRACRMFGQASMAAGHPKEAEAFFLKCDDYTDYGTRDRLFEEAASILSPESLERIIEQWRFRAKGESFDDFWGIRVRLAQVAESIGNAELYEEASLCGRPIDEYPLVAMGVAKVYLASGKPEIALTKMPSEAACRHHFDRERLMIEIHQALGNTEQVAAEYWKSFERSASNHSACGYLENIQESDHETARERMNAFVLNGDFTPLRKATFFAEMGDATMAAQIVEENAGQFDGDYYAPILDLIELIEEAHPLAASILYRANMESILDRGSSKYYHHAVRYARKLAKLAERITDWKSVFTHEDYWRAVEQKHARKRSFWNRMEE